MLKRTGFKIKPRKPLKRSGFKMKKPSEIFDSGFKYVGKPLRQTKLRKIGQSSTAKLKREIQALLRLLVIARDKRCIMSPHILHDQNQILQADHLITRSNNATYADSRLVVCICKDCHDWKSGSKEAKEEYDKIVKRLISSERSQLWEKMEAEQHKVCIKGDYEWKQEIEKLKKELENYKQETNKINY